MILSLEFNAFDIDFDPVLVLQSLAQVDLCVANLLHLPPDLDLGLDGMNKVSGKSHEILTLWEAVAECDSAFFHVLRWKLTKSLC